MSVVLAYKNFAANRNISHIGLGVAAINTAKVLRQEGIKADVWPILSAADLRQKLRQTPAEMSAAGAALEIARHLRAPLELWLSGGRTEGGGESDRLGSGRLEGERRRRARYRPGRPQTAAGRARCR